MQDESWLCVDIWQYSDKIQIRSDALHKCCLQMCQDDMTAVIISFSFYPSRFEVLLTCAASCS